MNVLIIYKSFHRMNTEKVAKAMAEASNATLKKVDAVRPEELAAYDLVGSGQASTQGSTTKIYSSWSSRSPGWRKTCSSSIRQRGILTSRTWRTPGRLRRG